MYFINVIFMLAASAVSMIVAQHSPVLMWSPERSMVDLPDVSDVDSFTASDFYNQYLSPVMNDGKGNSVVFLQDKLSVDDFTKYADVFSIDSDGGAFKNIKQLVDDHFSLEIPQVDSPHVAIDNLKNNFDGSVHIINNPAELGSLRLENSKKFLLIVNLQPIVGAGDVEKTISQNDGVVGVVIKHLHDKGIEYSALFTGKSGGTPEELMDLEPVHSGRHLLATADPIEAPCTYENITTTGGNILVYLCSFKVCIKDKNSKTPNACALQLNNTLTNASSIAGSSVSTNHSATIKLSFKGEKAVGSSDTYDIEVDIDVNLMQDRWIMDKFTLNLSPTSGGNVTMKQAKLINIDLDKTVPRLYSFHCTQLMLNLETLNETKYKDNVNSYVQLDKFQFQVFDQRTKGFFFAQDCVGFFTAGIWMGIVPGVVMIAILIWGTMMVLSLSVMDKFDNPKGKTITVNTGE